MPAREADASLHGAHETLCLIAGDRTHGHALHYEIKAVHQLCIEISIEGIGYRDIKALSREKRDKHIHALFWRVPFPPPPIRREPSFGRRSVRERTSHPMWRSTLQRPSS